MPHAGLFFRRSSRGAVNLAPPFFSDTDLFFEALVHSLLVVCWPNLAAC